MEKVQEIIKEIREGVTQKSASQKDETRVMRAMLNDKEYEVGVYGKEGLQGTVCPAKEARDMISSVISSAAKIPQEEATKLADDHEFSKAEANNMIAISKEYVNTYLGTTRKLPFGGRETFDISLTLEEVPAGTVSYPKQVGVDENEKPKYAMVPKERKGYTSAKVTAKCPSWIK